jgi:hypothetical protein
MLQLSRAGIDGLNMTFVNYEDELVRIIRDVLPLLEQAGLRRPFAPETVLGIGLRWPQEYADGRIRQPAVDVPAAGAWPGRDYGRRV